VNSAPNPYLSGAQHVQQDDAHTPASPTMNLCFQDVV
jgi:hypothetical protein